MGGKTVIGSTFLDIEGEESPSVITAAVGTYEIIEEGEDKGKIKCSWETVELLDSEFDEPLPPYEDLDYVIEGDELHIYGLRGAKDEELHRLD